MNPRSALATMLAVLTAGSLALASCASPPAQNAPPGSAQDSSSTSGAPLDSAQALITIEEFSSAAEDLYDFAAASDWGKASGGLRTLRQSAEDLRGRLHGLADRERPIAAADSALALAIGQHDHLAAMRAANAATWEGAELAGRFHPHVPADVAKLDYFGRELAIGAEGRDLAALERAAAGASLSWHSVRPAIESRGGVAEAARFGALMDRLADATTAEQCGRLATPILDEVDRLEAVFTR